MSSSRNGVLKPRVKIVGIPEARESVLDASALLAWLLDEPGAQLVREALTGGVFVSSANWAEVLSKLVDVGTADVESILRRLRARGLVGELFTVIPLTVDDAVGIARFRAPTRRFGLSLGDRAALALAVRLGLPVLTADRTWQHLSVGVPIRLIR